MNPLLILPLNMLHLPTDRLAELGDSVPTPEEAAHIAHCIHCAGERAAYRSLVALARAERESIGLPLSRWETIAAALSHAGEVGDAPLVDASAIRLPWLRRRSRGVLQLAAGLLLVAGGMVIGRVSAGAPPLPREAAAPVDSSELASQRGALLMARRDSLDSGDVSPVAYRSRLAALDRVISTTREALRVAPHDPVINGYYLTTLGQREATLRQLNTALPTTLRVNSF